MNTVKCNKITKALFFNALQPDKYEEQQNTRALPFKRVSPLKVVPIAPKTAAFLKSSGFLKTRFLIEPIHYGAFNPMI